MKKQSKATPAKRKPLQQKELPPATQTSLSLETAALTPAERERFSPYVLRHLAAYRLSFRPIIEKILCGGKNAEALIQNLLKKGLVESKRIEGNNLVYYQLTKQGAAQLGLSPKRTPGDRALPTALAVLWFCTMGARRRHRIDLANLPSFDVLQEGFLGTSSPNTSPYCLEEVQNPKPNGPRIIMYQVYVPGREVENTDIVEKIRSFIKETEKNPLQARNVKHRAFALAVVLESFDSEMTRCKALDAQIKAAGLKQALIRIEPWPGLSHLKEALFGKEE